jgi:glutathione S-transferase
VAATLYGIPPSHPSHAARLMLECKGLAHRVVWLVPGMHPVQLRMRGFRGATVPAMKLDGRRIQGSLYISRALDEVQGEPRLFPAEPERRAPVEDAERWGEQVLQPAPRRIWRWILAHSNEMRRRMARGVGMPVPGLMAALNAPVARYFARKSNASEERVRQTIAELPSNLDRVDELLADGVIGGEEPNAADFQIGTSVRALLNFEDIAPAVEGRAAAELARQVMPEYRGRVPSGYLPPEWLEPIRG